MWKGFWLGKTSGFRRFAAQSNQGNATRWDVSQCSVLLLGKQESQILDKALFYLPVSTFGKAKHEIFSGDTFYVDRTHFVVQVKRQESSTISGGLRASPRTKIFFNFSGGNSPVLNPPLAAPDLMPSAANGAQKSQKLLDFYLSAWIRTVFRKNVKKKHINCKPKLLIWKRILPFVSFLDFNAYSLSFLSVAARALMALARA